MDTWHDQQGAQWRLVDSERVVADYGDSAAEARALHDGCGVVERRWRRAFWVRGEDRGRFLNAYLTCDVVALEAGQGVRGFFTSSQGRILADAVITVHGEGLRVEVPAGRVETLLEHLGRYILADRVELAPEIEHTLITRCWGSCRSCDERRSSSSAPR